MPGETFHINVKGTGQRNGSAPAVIAVQLAENYYNANLIQLDKYKPNYECNILNLSLITDQIGSTIKLKIMVKQNRLPADRHTNTFRYALVYIVNCSWGFELINGRCECAKLLQSYGMLCYLDQQLLEKPAGALFWIGCEHYHSNQTCQSLLFTRDCGHMDYCDTSALYITVKNRTSQCKPGRTGIGCGACQAGYSLQLFTSHCVPCSNVYLSLEVAVHLSAGIIVVILLMTLNLPSLMDRSTASCSMQTSSTLIKMLFPAVVTYYKFY